MEQDNRRKFKKFEAGERKVEWQEILTTELVMGSINPIYLRSFTFSSANYAKIQIKMEVWQSNTGLVTKDPRHSTFIGEVEMRLE